MSAHSASYYSHWADTHQNDPEKGERFCDHRHCISLAESACDSCGNRFCDAHGDVEKGPDDPGVCWACMEERSDREAREASVMQHHCTGGPMPALVAVNAGHCPKCKDRFVLDPWDIVPRHISAEQIYARQMREPCSGTGQPAECVKVWEPRFQYRKRVSK
jgi:hypothetical protein